jgi:hypothetical protein
MPKFMILLVLLFFAVVGVAVFVWLIRRLRQPLGPGFERGFSLVGGAASLALVFVLASVPFIFAAGSADQMPLFMAVGGPIIGFGLFAVLCLVRAWQAVRWLGIAMMVLAVAKGPVMYYMRSIILSAGAPSGNSGNVFVINIVICVVVFFAGLAVAAVGSGLAKGQSTKEPRRKKRPASA